MKRRKPVQRGRSQAGGTKKDVNRATKNTKRLLFAATRRALVLADRNQSIAQRLADVVRLGHDAPANAVHHSEPHSLRRLEIDRKFELAWLLDGQVCGLGAFENRHDIVAGEFASYGPAGRVAHQATVNYILSVGGQARGQRLLGVVDLRGEGPSARDHRRGLELDFKRAVPYIRTPFHQLSAGKIRGF